MKNKEQYKIKPFSDYRTSLILEALWSESPRVASFSVVRNGIKSASKKLRSIVFGILSKDDCGDIAKDLVALQTEAEYSLLGAITIIGHATKNLQDYAEYQAFSNICLPMRSSDTTRVMWNDRIKDAVARHYSCMSILKQEMKSAPTYRKKGHDYCEDMLEMGVRVSMRPGVVKFTRSIEKKLGWPSVEKSGILSHVEVGPLLERKRKVQ